MLMVTEGLRERCEMWSGNVRGNVRSWQGAGLAQRKSCVHAYDDEACGAKMAMNCEAPRRNAMHVYFVVKSTCFGD